MRFIFFILSIIEPQCLPYPSAPCLHVLKFDKHFMHLTSIRTSLVHSCTFGISVATTCRVKLHGKTWPLGLSLKELCQSWIILLSCFWVLVK